MDQAAIQNIRHYIATMTIGLPDDVPRAKSANMVDVTKLASLPHGLVSGSNLLQFSRDIGPELRSAVALSLLAAQRVATTSQAVTTPSAWVEAHNAVLQNLGWQIEGGAYTNQTLSGDTIAVHEAIIPLLKAAFGPAAAVDSAMFAALSQLKSPDADAPWINVFERNGRRFDVQEIHFTVVGKVGSRSTLAMVGLRFGAAQNLFFMPAGTTAKFESARTGLSIATSQLSAMNDDLQAKLIGHIKSYVTTIDV